MSILNDAFRRRTVLFRLERSTRCERERTVETGSTNCFFQLDLIDLDANELVLERCVQREAILGTDLFRLGTSKRRVIETPREGFSVYQRLLVQQTNFPTR